MCGRGCSRRALDFLERTPVCGGDVGTAALPLAAQAGSPPVLTGGGPPQLFNHTSQETLILPQRQDTLPQLQECVCGGSLWVEQLAAFTAVRCACGLGRAPPRFLCRQCRWGCPGCLSPSQTFQGVSPLRCPGVTFAPLCHGTVGQAQRQTWRQHPRFPGADTHLLAFAAITAWAALGSRVSPAPLQRVGVWVWATGGPHTLLYPWGLWFWGLEAPQEGLSLDPHPLPYWCDPSQGLRK